MEELEYEFLCGKKINSKLLYLKTEKQLFKLKSKNSEKCYYVCYFKPCNSRVELLLANSICVKPKKQKNHNHPTQEKKYEELKAIESIKKNCIENAATIGDVNATSCIRSAYKRATTR